MNASRFQDPPPVLEDTLALVAAGAAARDATRPAPFPADAIELLCTAGVLSFNAHAGEHRRPAAAELTLVRRVAAADGSVGRILDGHLNAVERLAVHAPPSVRDTELAAVRAGTLVAGVWGGDPVGGEGSPAALHRVAGGEVVRGVKTFCSGAGGLQRAAVLVHAPDEPRPVLAWLDLTDARRVEIDESWYRASGLTASASHRVIFDGAPVLARLGPPGAIGAQPWFGRDALRTAASWAGMADCAVAGALRALSERSDPSELEALAVGRILAARATIDTWLATAADAMDAATPELGEIALHARTSISGSCREILDRAARATGSRPFARGEMLDRARRDLELFLLQHRLDPMLARAGHAALREASR